MRPNTRPDLPPGLTTLPARYYTDPAQFQAEMDLIWARMWLYAGRASDIPAAGDFFLREVAGAQVLVVRTEDGRLAAHHNVCRHRGTLLCREESGRLPGRIQCPYHAWTYGLDGRLLAAPHMERVQGFRESDFPLASVALGEWDGHVFINLSADPMPFERHVADLPERMRPWRMEELRRVERRVDRLKANWKLVIQNYSECLHCPIAHPLLNKLSHYMSGDNDPPQPTYLGGRMELRDGVASLTVDGATDRACLPGLGAEESRQVWYYALLPNLLLNLHPDYMMTVTLVPQAADRTDVVCDWHFHPDEMAKPGFDPRGAIEFWELTNRQDWELSERAQEGISSRGYRPGPYSNREELLLALDRLVLERTGPAGGVPEPATVGD